jgi:hypothetical protein
VIVVGATLPPFKMGGPEGYWASWLTNAAQIKQSHPDVYFVVALELDARGLEHFQPLLRRMDEVGAFENRIVTFSYDDGDDQINSGNRLVRICTGRNLLTQWAVDAGASHILFADADTAIPGDAIPKLLELDWPVCGGRVPTYCLSGQPIRSYPFPVSQHMNTAGFLLVAREAFRRLRWRTDPDLGLTDDPCYHADATALGWPTRVREDCVAAHYPPAIGPLEVRGHDLKVYR